MPDRTSIEEGLDARPTRRTFTADYKARILAEYEAATADGEKSALLRRERLYYSHIIDWRKARDAGAAAGLVDRRQSARPGQALGGGGGAGPVAPRQRPPGGRAGQDPHRAGHRGKSTRALGTALRE